jgi:AraC family transcriptional activator of pobA
VVDEPLGMHALAGARAFHQRHRALFEHAGANAAQHILGTLALKNDRVDTIKLEQTPEHQARRTRSHNHNLMAHALPLLLPPACSGASAAGMDRWRNCLHYPNMDSIPTYALYGEAVSDRQHDWLHWETIQSRSSLHRYRIAPHRHEQFFQILSLTGGRAEVTLDGSAFDLTPPAVVVVPPLTVHGYVFSPDVEGVIVTLMARDMVAEAIVGSPACVISIGTASILHVLDGLLAEADRPALQHDLAMRAHLTLLQVALHRARSLPASSSAHEGRARLHVGAFRALVDEKFRETRRIADYADALGISQTHLSRVCRQVLGASALTVIERRIALEARRQLLFSTLSIKQIGAGLGYDDPAYFTRMLKRVLGVPPLTFRRQAGS